ncbi:PXA domain protein 1, partial [Pseudocercospora fuligena]
MAQGAQRPTKQYRASSSNKPAGTKDTVLPRQHPDAARDDAATVAYIKRVLCQGPREASSTQGSTADLASKDLEELLPPLTSSNAVDVELYAFIAVILSFAVQSWYQRITPDHQFVGEIVQIIAHCTRGLEGRLRHVDLESLILDELPDLLTEHVNAVRMSQTSRVMGLTIEERRLRYHALRPHMALEPVPSNASTSSLQQENEVAWCLLLVNRILPLLLPPEDLQNPCLEVLVSEIFSELIFHNGLCGKACEPWLLWEGITKVVRPFSTSERMNISRDASDSPNEALGVRPASGARASDRLHSRGRLDAVSRTFWLVMQSMITGWILLRSFLNALMQASSIPSRRSRPTKKSLGSAHRMSRSSASNSPDGHGLLDQRPIIGMSVWGCMSQLLSLDRRMPWLTVDDLVGTRTAMLYQQQIGQVSEQLLHFSTFIFDATEGMNTIIPLLGRTMSVSKNCISLDSCTPFAVVDTPE